MSNIKALSIRQPWLDLILRGKKSLELRQWNPSFRGLIALHSSTKIDFHAAHFFGYTEPWKLERGKVLGIANLTSVKELDEKSFDETISNHLFVQPFPGLIYAIMLADVFVLPKPIAVLGRLYLFPLEENASKMIISQLPLDNMLHQI